MSTRPANLGLKEAKLPVLLKEQLVGIERSCLLPASIYRGGERDPGGRCRAGRAGWKVMGSVFRRARSRGGGRRCRGGGGAFG